ncbi:MAG: hypothetical protein HND27_06620 [Bacteroidetes bacterium]|nr:hypothetical protein [Bacteroidota bacterium]MBV6460125.1 hypothetical protein [Flavobacteriales bacterium]WKZ73996.1 MAG: hypothetical protein QY303_07505 [Vicingaceae bacterium]MCL4816475.1 hypothetical protein [Flavobacteriales bacterium]NOG95438.1 hypothetical protein [Bacteroidota bacterium]
MFGIRYVGHLFFIIYAVLSVYYATERIVFIDSAKYLFDLINHQTLFITGREGGYPVLLLPLLFIKLKLSLYLIIVAFSLSYALLFYLIFLLVVYVLKNAAAAWLLIFSLILCTRDTFYYPATEVYLGMAYVCILYAVLFSEVIKHRLALYTLSLILIYVCYLTHPITIFLILPLLLFKFFELTEKVEKWVIAAFACISFLFFVIRPFIEKSVNANEYTGYRKAFSFFSYLPEVFTAPSANFFYIHTWQSTSIYLLAVVLLGANLIFYLFKRNFEKAIILSSSVLAVWLLAVVVYIEGESAMVLGKAFAPLAFLCSLPLFHDVLYEKKKWFNLLVMLLLSGVLFLKFRDIALIGKHQKQRIENVQKNIQQAREQGVSKAISKFDTLSSKNGLIPWAYSMESIILSSFDESEQSVTIFIERENNKVNNEVLEQKDIFLYLNPNDVLPQEQLNAAYFKLPKQKYVYLK